MNAYRLLIVALAIALVPLLLWSQGEEENLYIPPTLVARELYDNEKPPRFEFHQFLREESLPLLPILFFDHPGDWTIPSRYRLTANARDYVDTADVWPQVEDDGKYYELLDIIGYRMSRYPATRITLKPGFSAEQGETPEVAFTRAEVIRDYLTTTWKIEPIRITVATPELLSSADDILPYHEEARRVMIETTSWELIRPVRYAVRHRHATRHSLSLLVRPNVDLHEVDSVEIIMTSNTTIVGRDGVSGDLGGVPFDLRAYWNYRDYDPRTLDQSIVIEALVITREGRVRRSNPVRIESHPGPLPIDAHRDSRTALVLPFFGFRDSTLNDYHRLMLREIIDAVAPTKRLIVETISEVEFTEDGSEDPIAKELLFRQEIASHEERSTPPTRPFLPQGDLVVVGPPRASIRRAEPPPEDPGTRIDPSFHQRIERNDNHPAYLLPYTRTTSVIDFIRDSLGISIVNEEQRVGYFDLRSIDYYPLTDRTILRLPEDRWYGRYVKVELWGEDEIRKYEGREE